MANVIDFCEPGPLLNDEVLKPPTISKATVQRCISKLSQYLYFQSLPCHLSTNKKGATLLAIISSKNKEIGETTNTGANF